MEEELQLKSSDDDDQFFDALDEFLVSNFTSIPEIEQQSTEISNISQLEPMESEASSSSRSISDSKEVNPNSTQNTGFLVGISARERRNKIITALKECERSKDENFTETQPPPPQNQESSTSFLVVLAGLVIKVITFQVSLLYTFFSFPIWFSHFSIMLLIDPYKTLKRAKDGALDRFKTVWSGLSESFAPFLFDKLKEHKYIAKLALKFGWGFVWSVYICFVLFGFLVIGFVIGGVMMRYLVEEPIQMMEALNFDFTRTSPVALVPIIACPSAFSGVKYQDAVGKSMVDRVLPVNHKLQLTILLTMPESDYNRKLGVFQVRADFLSENGEIISSSRHPCMLQFKSHLIRYLETFLKSVPLLAGYTSETQVLNIKMKGFSEGYKPTSCIRVILEQRAEYRSGAGIPEIYDASLLLESELPLLKRFLWYWKKTIFVWISMMSFTMEVLVILLCCRPVLIPRARPRHSSTSSNAPESTVAPVVSN